jgi:diguanylate cyclase (GGDEF)-like protein
MDFLKFLGLGRRSLKYKLLLAFALMSIIPLLIMMYFVVIYVFPESEVSMFQVTAIALFALWIAWTGYVLAKDIVIPVINLAIETKILVSRDDELGEIATAVNTMTGRMRSYLSELQKYSKETTALNVKIHRKVLTLTNLMRLGDLISSGADFEEVLRFATERIAGELYGGFCTILIRENAGRYFVKASLNNSGREIGAGKIESTVASMRNFLSSNEYLLADSRPMTKPWQAELKEGLDQMNVILFPMKIKTDVVGVIVFGSFDANIKFNDEDIEVLKAFEKELILGYQSFLSLGKVKSLEMVDSLTGLYTFSYLEDRLEDEIARAVYYQRPCSLIVVNVDNFERYSDRYGALKAEQALKQLGDLLSAAVPPIGKVAKADGAEFGILLPEMNKREGLELAEDIRRKAERMEISPEPDDRITVSIGVSENPIDGGNAKEIISKAKQYVNKAKEQGKNKVLGES